jgi:hydroxymethylpyrimidine pyrophosphatase-like HAD family hydrolase
VPGIDLVVTDLDGTLWGSDERIHARTLRALETLEARGVPVLVATGRRLRSAAGTLARGGAPPPARGGGGGARGAGPGAPRGGGAVGAPPPPPRGRGRPRPRPAGGGAPAGAPPAGGRPPPPATLARGGARLPALVVLDGALGRDLAARRVFHQVAFPPQQAVAVLDSFHDAGLSPCVYVDRDDAEVVVGPAPSTNPRHAQAVGRWLCEEDDLERVVRDEPVLMFSVVGGDRETLEPVADAIRPQTGAAAVTRDVIVGGVTLTVRPPGINKWQGVLAWCADQGLDAGRVLAVGDGQNDLELLAAARVACVVEDGCEDALALADHVLGPADSGGWSAVCGLL